MKMIIVSYDTHNKNFYKRDGLIYSRDWKTQLKKFKEYKFELIYGLV